MKCNVQNPRFSFRKTVGFPSQMYSRSWTVGKDDRNHFFLSLYPYTQNFKFLPIKVVTLTSSPILFFQSRIRGLFPPWVMLYYQMSELHGGDSKILCLVTLKARMVQRHNSIAVCVVFQASVFPFKTFQVSILTHKGTTTCLVSLLYCSLTSCFTVFQQCFRVGKYSAMQFIGAELNNWLTISSDFFARN